MSPSDHRPQGPLLTVGRTSPGGEKSQYVEGGAPLGTNASEQEWLRVPGGMRWRRTFPGTKEQAGAARRFVEVLFTETGRADDAGLIVAELVNNSLFYTRSGSPGGWFGVEVIIDVLARITVTDLGGSGRPLLKEPAPDELSLDGRGLFIVAELALSLGIHGSPALGHSVWADLDLAPAPKAPDFEPAILRAC